MEKEKSGEKTVRVLHFPPKYGPFLRANKALEVSREETGYIEPEALENLRKAALGVSEAVKEETLQVQEALFKKKPSTSQ